MACLLLLLSPTWTMGQELRFSQAIFIELQGISDAGVPGNEVIDSYALNVPTGKTVKITSVSTGLEYSVGSSAGVPLFGLALRIYLNGKLLYADSDEYDSAEFRPIWLPPGQYNIQLVGTYDNAQPVCKAFVSGVEFNLE